MCRYRVYDKELDDYVYSSSATLLWSKSTRIGAEPIYPGDQDQQKHIWQTGGPKRILTRKIHPEMLQHARPLPDSQPYPRPMLDRIVEQLASLF